MAKSALRLPIRTGVNRTLIEQLLSEAAPIMVSGAEEKAAFSFGVQALLDVQSACPQLFGSIGVGGG
jgi:hypothetical protein